MDYHNADGSIAEMCGNGVRVFARYLTSMGLVDGTRFAVATRAGLVDIEIGGTDPELITAGMTRPVLGGAATTRVAGREVAGTTVNVGNPHLVCAVPDLGAVDLRTAPELASATFPESANVEFVTPADEPVPGTDAHVRMRVYERGAAETLSCGTGACAVAAVALHEAGLHTGAVAVDLPGGRLTVTIEADRCLLTGPAVLVATGEFNSR
jgi:diaminopimelate epimerase